MNYDTSKIDEWTVEMCQEYLAAKNGWTWRPYADSEKVRLWSNSNPMHSDRFDHPIPASLDCAAMLPEGWALRSLTAMGPIECLQYSLNAVGPMAGSNKHASVRSVFCEGSELLARFRLRCRVESLTVRAEID